MKQKICYDDVKSKVAMMIDQAPFTRFWTNFCGDEFCSWTRLLTWIRENPVTDCSGVLHGSVQILEMQRNVSFLLRN